MSARGQSVIELSVEDLKIPPQPEALIVAQREIQAKEPNLLNIAKAIRNDLALSAAVLKVVNSAQFSLPTKIVSIPQAVSYMGLTPTTHIIAAIEIRRTFTKVPGLSMERFWDTATDVAKHCAWVAKRVALSTPDEAYTIGLFHDCGIPVIAQKHHKYSAILAEANSAVDRTFTEVEDDYIHTNHAVVGYLVTRSWNLPQVVREAVRYHHEVDTILQPALTHRSPLASLLAILKVATHANDVYRQRPEPEWQRVGGLVLEYLGLTEHECEEMIEDMVAQQRDFS